MLQLLAAAAADESSNIVALAGIIATAAVAVLGLFVQWSVGAAQRRQERRRARYEELAVLYEELAERLMLLESTVVDYIDERGGDLQGVAAESHRMTHLALMLQLHRCPDYLGDAWNRIDRAFRPLAPMVDGGEQDREAPEEFVAAVHDFYTKCGQHLREVWPPPSHRWWRFGRFTPE